MQAKWIAIAVALYAISMFGGMAYSDGKKFDAIAACYQAGQTAEECNKIK